MCRVTKKCWSHTKRRVNADELSHGLNVKTIPSVITIPETISSVYAILGYSPVLQRIF